jgi:hypothetical protein
VPTQSTKTSVVSRCAAAFVVATTVDVLSMASLARPATTPVAHAAAVCDDYETQADAQRAADTRDADGDGIYCVIYPR